MRKISKMYQLSGGCDWHHKCKECVYLSNELNTCVRHPGLPETWNGGWLACKWFSNDELLKAVAEQTKISVEQAMEGMENLAKVAAASSVTVQELADSLHQMTIEEYLKDIGG